MSAQNEHSSNGEEEAMDGAGGATQTEGVMMMVEPIPDSDLSADLQRRFTGLMEEIHGLPSAQDAATLEAACENLCNHIHEEVTNHPVLAKTVSEEHLHWSLLKMLCMKSSHNHLCHPAFKFLIEKNPHALIWKQRCEYGHLKYPIHDLAGKHAHCVLLPWIAQHYKWVFDHNFAYSVNDENNELAQGVRLPHLSLVETLTPPPPHLLMVLQYRDGTIDASLVRQFYELYPQGLGQGNCKPLRICINNTRQADRRDLDLIRWMARQNPESMSYQDGIFQSTPLHCACVALSSHSTDIMAEICCFLATECPESIRMNFRHRLPIQVITKFSNRSAVQTVLVVLLRAYPESIDESARSVPFIQQVEPLLQEERALQQSIDALTETCSAWGEAEGLCNHNDGAGSLQVSVLDVFKKWATMRKQKFSLLLADIPGRITEIGRHCEGEDVESDNDDNLVRRGRRGRRRG